MWRKVALTKLNFGASWRHILLENKKTCATYHHISLNFATVRFVAKSGHMWRYVAIRVDLKKRHNLILLAPLCAKLRHNLPHLYVAPCGATCRHNSPCGAKITNECVPYYMPSRRSSVVKTQTSVREI